MERKYSGYTKLIDLICVIAIVVFTFPRSIDNAEFLHTALNMLKIFFAVLIIFLSVLKKFKYNRLIWCTVLYSLVVFLSSVINKTPIILSLKVYILNIVSVITISLLAKTGNSKKSFQFLSKYFFVLILISFIQILMLFVSTIMTNSQMGNVMTILGQDNRIVLYILIELLLLCYCNDAFDKIMTYVVLAIGIISMILCCCMIWL